MSKNKPAGLAVIGGGITGFCAGIAWALTHDVEREPVTVFEKQPIAGGCVTSFRRKGYLFDTAQIVPDCRDVLDYLGVELELVRFAGDYCRIFKFDPRGGPARVLDVPSGFEEFTRRLGGRFPAQAEAIAGLMRNARGIYQKLRGLKLQPDLLQLLGIALPMAMGGWAALRETDYQAYSSKKEEKAGFFVDLVEKHLVPGLRTGIRFMDIASPASR
jgi:phytoene dehydrogenase-like protein